jgi:SAM-dependent methyltransferase
MDTPVAPIAAAAAPPPVDRTDKLLHRISRTAKILEIGPGYNPLVRKSDGWNVFTIDHGTADELRKKYRAIGTDTSRIDEIDFVWRGGPLESAVPIQHHSSFDACIASHVIEHVPDLVGFFNSIGRLLRPGGILSLAVPDKRYCFDYFHQLSQTGDVIEAHHEKRTRHSRKSVFNHAALFAHSDGESTWGQHPVGKLSLSVPSLRTSKTAFDRHDPSPAAAYEDCHAWYFTPSSFELIATELVHLGLIDFTFAEIFPAAGCEFHASLRKGAPVPITDAEMNKRRVELMKRIMLEQKEQIDYLLFSDNPLPGAPPPQTQPIVAPPAPANASALQQEKIEQFMRERDEARTALAQTARALDEIKRSRILGVGRRIRKVLGRPVPY